MLSRRLINDPQRLRELLDELDEDARFALERCTGGSGWPSCSRPRAASCIWRIRRAEDDPLARVKTDAGDACMLARFAVAEPLPEA